MKDRLTRRNQLYALVLLSGLTAGAQYTLQGVLATAHDPTDFPQWFWIAEYIAWWARALLEGWIVVYLFTTHAKTRWERVGLIFFEGLVLGLIIMTVGPAFRTLGYMAANDYASAMLQSLDEPYFTAWSFGIGAYTGVMMASAGVAYRIQPYDDVAEDEATVAEMQAEITSMQQELDTARHVIAANEQALASTQPKVEELASLLSETQQALEAEQAETKALRISTQEVFASVQWMKAQTPTDIARIVAFAMSNGRRPKPSALASLLGVSASTITRAYGTRDELATKLQEEPE